jgi:uncharacterized protein YoxC
MTGRAKLWILGLVALVALAACNDGPSREDFVAEANQICEDAQTSLEELGGDAIANQDPSEITQVASEQLSALRDELEDLTPPDELSEDFDSMIEGLDGAIEDVDSLSAAVEDIQQGGAAQADEESLQEVQQISQSMTEHLDQASEAARDMGLEGCGQTTEGAGG